MLSALRSCLLNLILEKKCYQKGCGLIENREVVWEMKFSCLSRYTGTELNEIAISQRFSQFYTYDQTPLQGTYEQKHAQGANRNRCHPAHPLICIQLPHSRVGKQLSRTSTAARIPCAPRSNKGPRMWATTPGTCLPCFSDHTFHLAAQGLCIVWELQ